MRYQPTRRDFLLQSGISAAAANLALNLPSLGKAGTADLPVKNGSFSSSAPAARPRLAKSVRLPNSGAAIEIDRYSLPLVTAVRHQAAPISMSWAMMTKSGWLSLDFLFLTNWMF